MDVETRSQIMLRAGNRCEYCLLPQDAVPFVPFHVEHVIARQHQVSDEVGNLAFACHRCNAYKCPNLSSIDPESGAIVSLFHPRRDTWSNHFELKGAEIVALTPTGRDRSLARIQRSLSA